MTHRLVEGVRQFQSRALPRYQELFRQLVNGQSPSALFITCSDSRIDPSLLTQTEPGELFIMRTAGNIVPPYQAVQAGEAGTIEFAVTALRVPDIIVCGHSQCGAMAGLLNPEMIAEMPAVRSLLKYAEPVRERIAAAGSAATDDSDRLNAAIEANVLLQIEHLRSHPSVAAALQQDRLRLHGWVYRFETGEVFAYDDRAGVFLPLQETHPEASAVH